MVYASDSSSLAILENLAQVAPSTLPPSLVVVSISIPDDVTVAEIVESQLPNKWREVANEECVRLGSEWATSQEELVLRVPSAVNSLDRNILLNPNHSAITRCRVSDPVPLVFDPRLLALLSPTR